MRSAITEKCAIVNDNIAPNAYLLPRKLVQPGMMTRIELTPANTIGDGHGVLNLGSRRRNTSGSCR